MAPRLSLNQFQRRVSMGRYSDQIKQTKTCPVAIKKSSKILSAIGCSTLKNVITEIDDIKNSSSIVTINFEQVLCARTQSSTCQQEEATMLFEAVEDLLLCDTRQWHRMKFVDTLQVHEFDHWKQQKHAMLYHVDRVAAKHDMSLRFRSVVKVPCDTSTSSVISFLKALAADTSIKTLMIAGGLKYSCPTEVWEDVARVFHYNSAETKSKSTSEIEFHIFTDGSDRAAAMQGEEEKSWSVDLALCIKALEKSMRPRGRVTWSQSEVEDDVNEEVDVLGSSPTSSSTRRQEHSKSKRKPSSRPSSDGSPPVRSSSRHRTSYHQKTVPSPQTPASTSSGARRRRLRSCRSHQTRRRGEMNNDICDSTSQQGTTCRRRLPRRHDTM